MANQIPYVPFDPELDEIFRACGINLVAVLYGNYQGWDPEAYAAAVEAVDYSFWEDGELSDEEAALLDRLYDYTLFYWSTEKPFNY